MNNYNERWTKEKFIEYRKLKRSGYTDKMLKEHFGEDIYHSDMYNKNGSSLPVILKFGKFINEIKITPEKVDYSFTKQPSIFIKGESDYIISFFSNIIPYIISLVYFPINNIETFNVIFTTRNQWNDYEYNLIKFLKKGSLTNDEFKILEDIIGKKTELNDLFPIFRKISWIILDFYENQISGELISIGDTENKKKINLYRNIIKDSFTNMLETEDYVGIHKYYIYKIN
jgi:hypothetical protein